jgi:hypothetical protein
MAQAQRTGGTATRIGKALSRDVGRGSLKRCFGTGTFGGLVGNAATLEEAQQELAENWRRWLAWAALKPD